MSYAVLRGNPTPAQLYLDTVLDEVLQSRGVAANPQNREKVTLPQIIYHCLKSHPEDVFMINGDTEEKITNGQILELAVPIARALVSKGARGKVVLMVMDNHTYMAATYLALLFAGTVPIFIPPHGTVFEFSYFLELAEPFMVLCDEVRHDRFKAALENLAHLNPEIVVAERGDLLGDGGDIEIPDSDPDDTVMMLPTSGSTGLPKASLMTHRGFVTQMAVYWSGNLHFPTPTGLVMVANYCYTVSFNTLVTSCIAYRIPVLMSPRPPSVDWMKYMLAKFKPPATLLTPAVAKKLLPLVTPEHFGSLQLVVLGGAPASVELRTAIKSLLPKQAFVGDVYGMTEAHGSVAATDPTEPMKCASIVANVFDYMLVDESGQKVELCQSGELYIRGPALIKGYYKNQALYEESFVDGWFKTGDIFYLDEKSRLVYMERLKFNFKFMGQVVSPEEVEQVIFSVPGVEDCVVCLTENGPSAAVVTHSDNVTREKIHKKVSDTLSEHKWLHGGIGFLSSLPHLQSGKIHRRECEKLIQDLIRSGECYQSWRALLDLSKFNS